MVPKSVCQKIAVAVITIMSVVTFGSEVFAAEFKIGIMQAQFGTAKKFENLEKYLNKKDIHVKFVPFNSYTEAAKFFDNGQLDGMFSGSAVAGIFILKGLAKPLVRPIDNKGQTTYWAVVIGRKGNKPFTGSADIFTGKRVAYSAIASSGEFFFQAIPGINAVGAKSIIAANHEDAIEKLSKGDADYAIIKNTTWDNLKNKYPDLLLIGQDGGQNPNNTLIVSNKTSQETIKEMLSALLSVGSSPEAEPARQSLGIKGYLLTSANDFTHTITLLKQAGVTADYDFQ